MKKKQKKNKTYVLLGLLLCLVIAVSFSIVLLIRFRSVDVTKDEDLRLEEDIEEVVTIEDKLFSKEEYEHYYSINSDYIGQVIFKSGIINEPVMYSNINSYYLRKNINKEYSIQGSVYMDDRNSLYDQNLILYGHYTEPGYTDYPEYNPDVRPMFSNLELLLDKENYEDNKTVYLYLKNEVIEYEVVAVYYCPLILDEETNEYVYVTDGYEYYLTDYTDEEFDLYKNTIRDNQRYNIDTIYSNYDRYLTLQTCVNAREDLREIVLCREVYRSKYE